MRINNIINKTSLQLAVTVLFCLMIALNVRILYLSNSADTIFSSESNLEVVPCEEHPIIQVAGRVSVENLNSSEMLEAWANLKPNHTKVIGYMRQKKGFLTVGIPSVKRVNGPTYLLQTLKSIIKMTSTEDKTKTVVLVFLADFDAEYNEKVVKEILKEYTNYINMGFIQIVQLSQDFYPPLENLKRNFNDKPERVMWRSKQVIDFAFMFLFARNLTNFYVQIEDDVECAPNFVTHINEFITTQTKPWAMLEFSELGFIGKLMKSEDLLKFARFLWTFYAEQPVDWLMSLFRLSMAQKTIILRKPTLFQHIGVTSSFDISKPNKLKDKYFLGSEKIQIGDNPPAAVVSDILQYEQNSADQAYAQGSGFFWGQTPQKGQAIYVVFDTPQSLSKIIFVSGSETSPKDVIKSGVLEASPELVSMSESHAECKDYQQVAPLLGGAVDIGELEKKVTFKCKCLRVVITENQEEWIIVPKIKIFTVKS